jgi:hypothetical protein
VVVVEVEELAVVITGNFKKLLFKNEPNVIIPDHTVKC